MLNHRSTDTFSDNMPNLSCTSDDVTKNRTIYNTVVSIEMFEIITASKECVLVTEMPSELVNWVDGHNLELKYGRACDNN